MFSIAASDFIFLTHFLVATPFHHLPVPKQGISLAVYTCLQGADPQLWKAEIRQHGCPAGTVLVDFHFSCLLLLSLLLKLFLCSKSSNPLFLRILVINLISYAPRQLISTSVKLKGCKCYFVSEEELKVPEVYMSFPRVSAVQL